MGMMLIGAGSLPAPAKCASCGDTDRDCIDFGITEEFYGAILVCVLCFRSAAMEWPNQIGLTDLGDYQALGLEYDRLSREREAIPDLIEDVRNELSGIIGGIRDRLSGASLQFLDEPSDEPIADGTVGLSEGTERQADSDAGDQDPFGIPSRSGDGHDPFS